MSKTVQWKRGNTAVNSTYVGAQGEITVDTSDWSIYVHDGITAGGYKISNDTDSNVNIGNLNIIDQTIAGKTSNANIVLSPLGTGQVQIQSNVSATYFLGNGAFLTGVTDSVGATGATGIVGATGLTGATGIGTNYSNANVISYSETGWEGNIIPSANAVYTLGNITNQWANIWVANNTIYLGNVAIGISDANVLLVNGQPTLSNGSSTTINTQGNITAGNLNAYRITTTFANIGNFEFYDNTVSAGVGNIIVTAGAQQWTFDNTSNLTIPQNGYMNFNSGGIKNTINEDFYIRGSDDEEDGWSIFNVIDDGAGNQLTKTQLQYNRFSVYTDVSGNNYSFDFREGGEFDVPKSIRGPFGGNLVISIGDQPSSNTFIDLQTRSYVGDALISNVRIANPNVTISTSSGAHNWTFGGDGNLNLPSEGNIVGITPNNAGRLQWLGNSSGDGNGYTTLGLIPDDTLVGNDQYLIIDPTAPGHIHIRAGGDQDNSSADLFLGGENSYFKIAAGANAQAQISSNSHSWTFGVDGTFTLPTDAGLNGSQINSVSNSSGDLNGYTTLQLIPDVTLGTGTDQYLIIDPTAPGHIHIRAGGTQDNSSADLILGGEYSHVRIPAGANSTVYIKSNDNNWQFGSDGWLNIPGSIYSDNNLNFETPGDFNPSVDGNILLYAGGRLDIVTNNDGGGAKTWGFSDNGNLSAPGNVIAIANISANYFVGNGSLLTGIVAGTNYTNTNVVNLLAAFGSNTIVTTGNISGNIVAASSNTHVMFNDDGLINGSSVFTFNKNGNILTVGTTGGTISVADIATPQAGVSLRLIPASGTTRSYGHLVPQFANTYDLGQSTTRWQNMYANLANIVSLTVTENLSTTGNLTAGNILANSTHRWTTGNARIELSGSHIRLNPDSDLSALAGISIGGTGYILGPDNARNITLNYTTGGGVGFQTNVNVGVAGSGGYLNVPGILVTGANAINAGVPNSILPNTISSFSTNINSYSQITFQNKSSGTDATADFILTADNGSDTVNYADFGIINSNYDNNTPTNSLGNIVYAADTYLYAQGNSSATSQSGGNLVIGTTTSTKTVKIFAGGANLNSLVANISSTGVAVTGNVSVSGNVTGTTPNVNLVAGSYTYTFDNTGNVTINGTGIRMPSRPASRVYGSSSNNIVANTTLTSSNFTVDYNQGSHLNASTGVFTAPVAGMYQTTLNARVGDNNGLNQILVLKNNGTLTGANVIAFWETDTNTGTASHFGTSGVANLVAGDTLRVKVVAGNIQFDSNDSWTVTYIG